jgi:hypothetical protein
MYFPWDRVGSFSIPQKHVFLFWILHPRSGRGGLNPNTPCIFILDFVVLDLNDVES